ncbi:tripartite tricarboxylate transporter TctB family protein, partial [Allomesorhizobium alhagi]
PLPEAEPAAVRGHDWGAVALAAIFLAIAGLAYWGATGMSAMGSVFPKTIALLLAVLSIALIVLGVMGRNRPVPTETAVGPVSNIRRMILIAIFAIWVWLLPVIGFIVTSFTAFVAMAAVGEHDPVPARTWLLRGLVAIVTVAVFWWLMADVLLLRMPRGMLM